MTLAGLNLTLTLVGADAVARPLLETAHEWIGNAFYWVIGLHAPAAIGHHVLLKDRTLRRMIRGSKRQRRTDAVWASITHTRLPLATLINCQFRQFAS